MKHKAPRPAARAQERGNIIWFLLVAIALMAALTVALNRSSDTTQQSGNAEMMSLQATEILRYAQGLEQAVGMMMSRGASGNDINFDNPFEGGYSAHTQCMDEDCMIFKAMGGAQNYMPVKIEWLDKSRSALPFYNTWIFTGSTCVQGVGDDTESATVTCAGDGVSNEDLLMMLPYVSKALCMQLNTLSKVDNPLGNPPVNGGDAWTASPQFLGTYAEGANIGVSNSSIYRKKSGCVEGAGVPPSDTYVFYYTLLAR